MGSFCNITRTIRNDSTIHYRPNKITRPVLSDDQLAELNIRLHEALQYAQPVEVKFYNNGFVDSVRLTIYRIDAINYEIDGYVYNQQQRQKISIFDILDIVLLP